MATKPKVPVSPERQYILYVNVGAALMNSEAIENYSQRIKTEFEKIGYDFANIAIIPVYEGPTRLEKKI